LIIDCLFEQRARQDTTLLLITHDESLAERCARRIRLADGTIAEDRTAALTSLGAVRRAR
jgi:putative ABC transport system ATP-binding protein